jgi:RHS repeat-associated protein
MRKGSALYYLLSDHLGSTSITTDTNGALVSELRYKPWGEVRYTSGTQQTQYQYTGQYSDSYINLLWYGSRHYDPALGRFIQPDSIVPLASQGVQAWDRYAYANNNPVKYTDPTGHCIGCVVAVAGITAAIVATPFTLSAFGLRPDVEGAMIASAVTINQASDILVTTGITVQSEYPLGIIGGDAQGWAQATYKELMDGEKDPYSPGAATTIMKDRIYGAINNCKLCNNGKNDGVDKLIVAAIAQNGYGLDTTSLLKSDG